MHARVPYTLIGDVGFYQRAEIKDALALLRLAATPDDAQADESFRRVINAPARGFGAKQWTSSRPKPPGGGFLCSWHWRRLRCLPGRALRG